MSFRRAILKNFDINKVMMVHSAENSLQRQLSAIIADQNSNNIEHHSATTNNHHERDDHPHMPVDQVGGPKKILADTPMKESIQNLPNFPVLTSVKTNPKQEGSFHTVHVPTPLSPPTKPPAKHNNKLFTYSLPNSPRLTSALLLKNKKKKDRCLDATSPSPRLSFQQTETRFQKSKSCGDGRASEPSVGFDDLLLLDRNSYKAMNPNTNTTEVKHLTTNEEQERKIQHDPNPNNYQKQQQQKEGELKCRGCLFLPGFGKGKPVKAKKESSSGEDNDARDQNMMISRTFSLEKFECGSWASSAIEEKSVSEVTNLFFDLPLELIRTKADDGDDAHSPVTAAFIFDKDRKGVLKNGCNSTRRSTAQDSSFSSSSSRHVRFSVSSPRSYPASTSSSSSCITPRLREARDDFNAFLEAQSAQ